MVQKAVRRILRPRHRRTKGSMQPQNQRNQPPAMSFVRIGDQGQTTPRRPNSVKVNGYSCRVQGACTIPSYRDCSEI
eukprot:scaffold4133_cov146-Amphora_coffeaeformis.AAC.10